MGGEETDKVQRPRRRESSFEEFEENFFLSLSSVPSPPLPFNVFDDDEKLARRRSKSRGGLPKLTTGLRKQGERERKEKLHLSA